MDFFTRSYEMSNASIKTDQLRAVLFATENSNNDAVLTRFSWAGNATSSYSFGILQFDVAKDHGDVKQFLASHGFTSDQIEDLSQKGGGLTAAQLEPLNRQLAAIPKADLDDFTNRNLDKAIENVDTLVGSLRQTNPAVADAIAQSEELQLAIADYDNQFHIDGIGGKAPKNSMLAYLEGHSVNMPGGTLKLGDTLTRDDLKNFIDATDYAQKHQKAMAGREERLNGALADLNIIDSSQVAQSRGTGDGVLKPGTRGEAVGDLQAKLGELGYTDSRGIPLGVDKDYGTNTKAAVETFQREHGLAVDGVAGSDTMTALNQALQAPVPSIAQPDAPYLQQRQASDPVSTYRGFAPEPTPGLMASPASAPAQAEAQIPDSNSIEARMARMAEAAQTHDWATFRQETQAFAAMQPAQDLHAYAVTTYNMQQQMATQHQAELQQVQQQMQDTLQQQQRQQQGPSLSR